MQVPIQIQISIPNSAALYSDKSFSGLRADQFQRRPIHALITDLKQRGLLEDTLLVWGSEFGRTPMKENRGGNIRLSKRNRPHGYKAITNPVSTQDLQSTILHLMGMKHNKLTFPFQG